MPLRVLDGCVREVGRVSIKGPDVDQAHANLAAGLAEEPVASPEDDRKEVGTFIGFMDRWIREENERLPAEQVDHAFRSLVQPWLANVLSLDIEIPNAL